MKSTEFLQAAIDVQAERGKQYDKPSGERSMGATIEAFNSITGSDLKEQDGWMLLGLLKLVRQAQNPDQYHNDSALDFVAYASLYAEAASEQCGHVHRDDVSEPSVWERAPSWAYWLAMDKDGKWHWYELKPYADGMQWWKNTEKQSSFERAEGITSMEYDWTRTLSRRPQ